MVPVSYDWGLAQGARDPEEYRDGTLLFVTSFGIWNGVKISLGSVPTSAQSIPFHP